MTMQGIEKVSITNVAPGKALEATVAGKRSETNIQKALRSYGRQVLAIRLVIFVLIVGAWEGAASAGLIDPFFFSKPSAIVAKLIDWIQNGTSQGPLIEQIWVTLSEAAMGFLIGSILGVVLGIIMGRNKFLADVFSIYIKVLNSVPHIVLGSIFVIALGIDFKSKVALSMVVVFFVVFSNAFQGAREADKALIGNARILGASPWQVTSSVIIPSAITWILASLHISFGFALVGAVVGEFLGARQGLGLLVVTEQGLFHADGVFASMIILSAIALTADGLLTALEKKLLKWRPTVN